MKKMYIVLLIIIVAAAASYFYFTRDTRQINVLVFSKTASFRHDCIPAGKDAILALGKTHGFSVDTTENADIFTEGSLKKYNVIIFLNTTGDILNDAQQLEFNRWIQAGGGFVGVHAAADTEYEWPWYGELVGAYFNGHPNDPNVREGGIDRVDKEHISTSHLPDRWERKDEWYNYKEIQPAINVLLNLDETSYEGGTNGKDHPISWYREFDGGRTWYTGLGHTIESFSDPDFLQHLWGGIQYAAGPGQPVDFNNARVAPEENRFQKVILDFNLDEPMEMEILPDGNILFIERGGAIKLFTKGSDKSKTVATLPVFSDLEDGLLGLALDPDYGRNNFLYLFYSPSGNESLQRVSRFVFKDGELVMDSEKILLTIPTQREQCCHSAGSMEFGPDGLLYIALGDNTSPRETGYAPVDERKGRGPWDAQKSSSNTNDLRGKILRIKPEQDGTYSIPKGNLFPDGNGGKPEIYVMGVRNPYRISIDTKTNFLYWGDVGPDAGKDSVGLGSKGYDEVNQARSAGNFGWPYFIGNNYAYNRYDRAKNTSGPLHDPKKPVNLSANNTGSKELPEARPAFIWYPYTPSKEFPLTGEGGRNAMAGPVFYAEDYPESEARYPVYYDRKLFIYDWMRGWIMSVTLQENGDFVRMERFLPNTKFDHLIDMVVSPQGDLYALEYGSNWFSQNLDARLIHIAYSSANRVPRALIATDKTIGKTPFTVSFRGDQSKDFDGDELVYAWDFGDGETSADINPQHAYSKPGSYKVKLTVTDPSGEKSESETTIIAGNDLPEIILNVKGNTQFYFDKESIDYEVQVTDSEDGKLNAGIQPNSVTVTADYLARGHDLTEIAQGHEASMAVSANLVGKALMEGSDCKACHQIKEKSVGPAYLDIATKYANANETVITTLAQKTIAGGSGVWGDLMMSPHPQLSRHEAEKMVKYILSLGGKVFNAGLPPSGTIAFNKHKPGEQEGKYILTASYTDQGANGMQPLTSTAVVTLSYPMIAAEKFSMAKKAMAFNIKAEEFPIVDKDMTVMLPSHEGILRYDQIDLTGVRKLKFYLGVAPNYFSGGRLEIFSGSETGKKIGEADFEVGLTSVGMKELLVDLDDVSGKHDLVFRFNCSDQSKIFAGVAMIELLRK